MIRNQKGFTLLEIIAVLVILGILAAVAVPKYISLLEEARIAAAQGAIAEVKGRASGYYGLLTLRNGAAPGIGSVAASVTAAPDVGGDFVVQVTNTTGTNLGINVTSVKGTAVSTVSGTWSMPQ